MISPEYSLVRLFTGSTKNNPLIEHICSLSDQDRYLRFGHVASRAVIEQYVQETMATVNTQTHADFWFGVTQWAGIVATLHVAVRGDTAEFAFTTLERHRGKKLGQLLFARGYQLVTEYSIKQVYVTFLDRNEAMKHIAKKFGLNVMTQGVDSEGTIDVQYPVSIVRLSQAGQKIIEAVAES